MAKKSNKTAHVLNLLAGHDAVKETEESSAAAEETISDDAAEQASAASPAEAEEFSNEPQESAVLPTASAPQPSQAPTKAAQTASQNNISLIDKTEDDPLADLIQEKLSSEFEKQMQESQADPSATGQGRENDSTNSANDQAAAFDANLSSGESDPSVSDPDSGVLENPGTEESLNPEENGSPDSKKSLNTEENGSPDSEKSLNTEKDGAPDSTESSGSEDDKAPDFTESLNPEDSGAADSGTSSDSAASSTAMEAEAISSEDNSDLQDALEQNTIESAHSLSEMEEEMEAMAEMDIDLKAEPKAAEPAAPEPEPEPEFAAVNVMERIVNDKIIYFMRQFDVCTCDRCKADVIALTLNGLLPKYIVTMPAAVDPLISYYTNRLISDVTVEATKACMIVKENPRH